MDWCSPDFIDDETEVPERLRNFLVSKVDLADGVKSLGSEGQIELYITITTSHLSPPI